MFTSQDLVTAPRCSPAVPNSDGSYLLFTESRYDVATQESTNLLKVVELADELGQENILASNDFSDPVWIPSCPPEVCYLRPGKTGTTVCVVNVRTGDTYVAAEINAGAENPKLYSLSNGSIAFVVSGLVGSDGKLYNETTSSKSSSARVFDTARIHSVS